MTLFAATLLKSTIGLPYILPLYNPYISPVLNPKPVGFARTLAMHPAAKAGQEGLRKRNGGSSGSDLLVVRGANGHEMP